MTGLDVIRESKKPDNGWLPMIDSAYRIVKNRNEYGDVNIGWNAGLIGENRPFYAECWATDGITMLTVYFSTKGIEDYTDEQVDKLLVDAGYYTHREKSYGVQAMKFTDGNGNEFFSANIAVGDEDDVFIDGATIYPFKILNEYNSAEKDE